MTSGYQPKAGGPIPDNPPNEGSARMTDFKIGDPVRKITGDYRINGEVRAVFRIYPGGPIRIVVRHEAEGGGFFCHIYAPEQLEKSQR